MIIKKIILQNYMYAMFWLFYGTVLLAPVEEVLRSDEFFRQAKSADRVKMLKEYQKELQERSQQDRIRRNRSKRSLENAPRVRQEASSNLPENIRDLEERLKKFETIHHEKELEEFMKSSDFKEQLKPIFEQLKLNDVLNKLVDTTEVRSGDIDKVSSAIHRIKDQFNNKSLTDTQKRLLLTFANKLADVVRDLTPRLTTEQRLQLDEFNQLPLSKKIDTVQKTIEENTKLFKGEKKGEKSFFEKYRRIFIIAFVFFIVNLLIGFLRTGNTKVLEVLLVTIMAPLIGLGLSVAFKDRSKAITRPLSESGVE